ncbi:MAG: PD-(D/E)XK nuclease family protein [Salibacteraceae bacterium]
MALNSETRFLDILAQSIRDADEKVLVVLPNKRSLFVLDSMTDRQKAELTTVDDLMQRLSGKDLVEPQELLLLFYEQYQQHFKKSQAFDQFVKWAVNLLSDFNDIDLYRIDIDDLFAQIHQYRETGSQFAEDKMGPIERSFRSFWKLVPELYRSLHQTLNEINLNYRGAIYRTVAELCSQDDGAIKEFFKINQVWWVGLVPGNPCEDTLLQWLEKNRELRVFADIDQYYINDPHHAAHRPFEMASRLDLNRAENNLATRGIQFHEHIVTEESRQLGVAVELLSQLSSEERKNTALVLTQEHLLIPLVDALHKQNITANVTMGYSIRNTSVHRFVLSWLGLYANATWQKDQFYFRFADLTRLFDYDLVERWSGYHVKWDILRHEMVSKNLANIPQSWLQEKLSGNLFAEQCYHALFSWNQDTTQALEKISALFDQWQTGQGEIRLHRSEREILKRYRSKLLQTVSKLGELLGTVDYRRLMQFVNRQMGYVRFYFEEPDNDCLQVMGILETRLIDFKRVIVLGCTEGALPPSTHKATFIPFPHRKHFGLPTHEVSEGLIAYHFYRMLQRTSEAHFIYHTATSHLGGGEPSRYLIQLQMELLENNPNASWSKRHHTAVLSGQSLRELVVEKTPEIKNLMLARLREKLSPSHINTYVNSPLDFYFRYVLRLEEEKTIEEEIQANTLGDAVHKCLQHIYTPFIGKPVNLSKLRSSISTVPELIIEHFAGKFQKGDLSSGNNRLLVEVAQSLAERFISFDLQEMETNGPVTIKHLEKFMNYHATFDGVKVNLLGFADRIDERNGQIRIVDYKTGLVKGADLRTDFSELSTDARYRYALQLACYTWCYCKMFNTDFESVNSYIVSFRNISAGYMPLGIATDDFDSGFLHWLESLVNDMLSDEPFAHKPDSKYVLI